MDSKDIRDQATLEAFLVTHPDMLDLDALNDITDALFTARQVMSAARAASLAGASSFQMSVEKNDDDPSSSVDVTFEFPDGTDICAMDAGLFTLPGDKTMEDLLDETGWGQPTLCLDDAVADNFRPVLEKCGTRDQQGYVHLPLDIQPRQIIAAVLGRDPFVLATAIDQETAIKAPAPPPRRQRRSRG